MQGRRKSKIILPGSILVGILLGLAVIIALPSTTPYSMVNNGPTGLSSISKIYNAKPIKIIMSKPEGSPNETALLIIHFSRISNESLDRLLDYVEEGGIVVASGDEFFLNQLLRGVNTSIHVSSSTLYDMVYNNGSRFDPIAYSSYCNTSLVLDKPHPVIGDIEPLAITSNFSYLDVNNNGYMDLEDVMGEWVVAGVLRYGSGELVIIGSPNVFTNKYIDANREFVNCIIGGRSLYIDQSQPASNPFESFKLLVKYQPSGNVRVIAVFIAGILGVAGYGITSRIE